MKILIAHDWAVVRAGISQILEDEFGPLEITRAPLSLEAFDFASGPWDLVFLELDVGSERGIKFSTALKQAYPRQLILAVCPRVKVTHFERGWAAYVQGAIAIEGSPVEWVTAARAAIDKTQTAGTEPQPALTRPPALSKSELRVLRLLAGGKSIKEVAAVMDVSASTVSTYRARMLQKLRLKSTGELIRYAFRNHLAH